MDNNVVLEYWYNLWAVLALLIAAAISFWKITFTATCSHPPTQSKPLPTPMAAKVENDAGLVAVTRGKFRVTYSYQEDDVMGFQVENETTTRGWSWEWERMRKGEMEWYTSQDFGMLNGAVVRLWEWDSSSTS